MKMLSPGSRERLHQVQLYLSVSETQNLMRELATLLHDAEASEHFHLISEDGGGELSVSIVTEAKLARGGYTAEERKSFGAWKPRP